jgi:hypothetical protein
VGTWLSAAVWLAAATTIWVEMHGPTGQKIYVNPELVASLREPLPVNRADIAKGTNCILFLSNGNFIAIRERCDVARRVFTQQQRQGLQ